MALALGRSAEELEQPEPIGDRRAPERSFRQGARPGRVVIRRYLDAASERLAAARAALRADPGALEARVAAARLHASLGELSLAIEVLEACPAKDGAPKSFFQDGGQLFLSAGLHRRAEKWLARAMAAAFRPGAELVQARERAAAGVAADAARGLRPGVRRRFLSALEALVRGRPETAVETLAPIVASHPDFAAAWLALRGALEALGRSAEVEALGKAWLKAAPQSAAGIGAAMSFRLSRRGLPFDPREPLVLRRMGESLTEVDSAGALRAGGDNILYLDRGGGVMTLEPVIPLAATAPQQTRFTYKVAPKFVAALDGAAVLGRGLVLNRDGEMPAEAWPPCHMGKAGFWRVKEGFVCDPTAYRNGLYPVRVFDTPALLMAAPTDNSFGDWVLNIPPRLALAEAAGVDCPIVLQQGVCESFIEMLVSLGWERGKMIFHDPRGVSIFPRLYTTSWPLLERDEAMRDLFGIYKRSPGRRTGQGERLYLSREGVGGRKLANEAEIRALFERRGFRAVRPETLGFQEGKDLIAGADLIAGPYGSAFLNVVHAPRPPSALVIMPPTRFGFLNEVAFWVGGCGGRLAYLCGDGEPDSGSWTAPADRVEAALDEFLAATAQA